MQKIVFFDIDGTLIVGRSKILPSTKAAINKLKEMDIMPVIATGRAPALIKNIAKELEIDTYISMNGQYIVVEGERIFHNPIKPEIIDRFTQFAQDNDHGYILCGSDEIFTNKPVKADSTSYKVLKQLSKILPSRIQMSYMKRSMKKYPTKDLYESKDVYQAILQAPAESEIDYIEAFPSLRFTRSNPIMFDVIKNGVSKATGIRKICQHYHVDLQHTFAFGDHLNDLEMLQYVGVGVAMGNAERETKEVADFITRPNDQDGIYHGLVEMSLIPDFLNK